jgi:hypothetical protein
VKNSITINELNQLEYSENKILWFL